MKSERIAKSGAPAHKEKRYKNIARAATGAVLPELQDQRVAQLAAGLGGGKDAESVSALVAAIYAMAAIGPENELEGMLVSQMIATNQAAMKCFSLAAETSAMPEIRASELRHAARFLQLYTRQIDTLSKLRLSNRLRNNQHIERAEWNRAELTRRIKEAMETMQKQEGPGDTGS